MPLSAHPNAAVGNRLVAALPREAYKRLLPHLQPIQVDLGEVIYELGEHLDYIYFPIPCIVSLLHTMESGPTAEMGLAGSDGVVGIAPFLGGETTPDRAVAQIGGGALRMKAKILQEEFKGGSALQLLLLRYTQALITQISQTAVCNRRHSLEQRLCDWLLLCHDRVRSDELQMTQEFISNMLGGRPREHHRGRRPAAGRGIDPICTRPHQDPRSKRAGGGRVRMLSGGQRRV